jgi:hypothetical protein
MSSARATLPSATLWPIAARTVATALTSRRLANLTVQIANGDMACSLLLVEEGLGTLSTV